MAEIAIGAVNDLSLAWDPDAARTARVLISEQRLEIVLMHEDPEWVREALEVLAEAAAGHCLTIVVASPELG